jgi:single-strand DNA-binding protein
MNTVTLIGNIGSNVELKNIGNDKLVVNLSVATNEDYTDSNGQPARKTTWHRIIAWNNVADNIAKHMRKGDFITIKGKLINREYESTMEIQVSPRKKMTIPVKRQVTEVQAFEVIKL